MQLSYLDTIFGVLVPMFKCVSSRWLLWQWERKGWHGKRLHCARGPASRFVSLQLCNSCAMVAELGLAEGFDFMVPVSGCRMLLLAEPAKVEL